MWNEKPLNETWNGYLHAKNLSVTEPVNRKVVVPI